MLLDQNVIAIFEFSRAVADPSVLSAMALKTQLIRYALYLCVRFPDAPDPLHRLSNHIFRVWSASLGEAAYCQMHVVSRLVQLSHPKDFELVAEVLYGVSEDSFV